MSRVTCRTFKSAPGHRVVVTLPLQPDSDTATARSFLIDVVRAVGALWARDVEIQQVAWRLSKMLLRGNVPFRCGNAGMPKRHGKLFDGCVFLIG